MTAGQPPSPIAHDDAAFADDGAPWLIPTLNALLRRRRTVLAWSGLFAAVAVVAVLMATPAFTATAKFQPVAGKGVADRLEVDAAEDEAVSADYYVALIQSPSFLSAVVARTFETGPGVCETLVQHYGAEGDSEDTRLRRAAEILGASTTVSVPRAVGTGPRIVTLSVSADSPRLAADVARAILGQIDVHNASVRRSGSGQTRVFVEGQVTECRKELTAAAADLAAFEASNRRTDTPRIAAQLEQLRREVRIAEERYMTLVKQLELARIQEQEDIPCISVIQEPEPPLVRSSPRRTQTVLIALVAGFVFGCLWALVSERFGNLPKDDPGAAELRGHLQSIVGTFRRPFGAFRRG